MPESRRQGRAQALRMAAPGRPGIRVIAKQFGASPMTVQTVGKGVRKMKTPRKSKRHKSKRAKKRATPPRSRKPNSMTDFSVRDISVGTHVGAGTALIAGTAPVGAAGVGDTAKFTGNVSWEGAGEGASKRTLSKLFRLPRPSTRPTPAAQSLSRITSRSTSIAPTSASLRKRWMRCWIICVRQMRLLVKCGTSWSPK